MGDRSARSAVCTSSTLCMQWPFWGQGASRGEESVLADSGREGEITSRVGQVRILVLLRILRDIHLLSMICGPSGFLVSTRVFPQPACPRLFQVIVAWFSTTDCSPSTLYAALLYDVQASCELAIRNLRCG
jgi:hypothetical protein